MTNSKLKLLIFKIVQTIVGIILGLIIIPDMGIVVDYSKMNIDQAEYVKHVVSTMQSVMIAGIIIVLLMIWWNDIRKGILHLITIIKGKKDEGAFKSRIHDCLRGQANRCEDEKRKGDVTK